MLIPSDFLIHHFHPGARYPPEASAAGRQRSPEGGKQSPGALESDAARFPPAIEQIGSRHSNFTGRSYSVAPRFPRSSSASWPARSPARIVSSNASRIARLALVKNFRATPFRFTSQDNEQGTAKRLLRRIRQIEIAGS